MADREGKSDCFLVLCGLPACGKTTLVNEFIQWKRHNIYDDTHVLHICYDEFIPSNLYEDEDGLSQQCMSANTLHETRGRSLWKWYRKLLLLSVERLVRILRIDTTDIGSTSDGHFRLKSETRDNFHEGKTELSGFWPQFIQKLRDTGKLCKCLVDDSLTLRCCHVIILDDNMFYRGMRYEYYQLARKCGLGYAQLFIDCSIDSALQRNVSRSNPVTMETIKTMTKRKALVLLIKNAASHPVPPLPTEDEPLKEKLQKANLDSLLHQADKVLRRTISKKMEKLKVGGVSKQEMQRTAQNINSGRKLLLEYLKKQDSQNKNGHGDPGLMERLQYIQREELSVNQLYQLMRANKIEFESEIERLYETFIKNKATPN
ncbi:L-seryl-tRNA(Sec) kinase isoform X2 [Nematostella vectensis]|uniref:L-seryl-tRNA(Sec) kinase isoform X2 n=1 Tax=Nematostella vectensis TaxID=45351 RepID=UPI0020779840|nr:L-seryl-tRNA(Sec) kinase isoform X2 [Nematostella vectensis]